ncbi:winged helix-turn-helix domain-containing protein [Brucella intermedia]|uniref:winged helix-turn-helix domain-containing protein n=1 Tax=Brucella intermedia TaxID=94625 RepID=UPI002557300F|nr:winged helix-turn-helix domain-containing protein [Brucella intermedia]MDL2205228.1 winged helix-turn-helix domain-containing protein [Brucella intermedia]
MQFRLLEALMQKPEIVWSRQELIDAVWGQGAIVEPRTVDIHIGHIRRALARYGPNLVRTVQGWGYALDRSAAPLQ